MDSLVIANDSNELSRIVNNLNLKAQALFLDIYYKNGVMSLSLTSPSQEYKNIPTTWGRNAAVKSKTRITRATVRKNKKRAGMVTVTSRRSFGLTII